VGLTSGSGVHIGGGVGPIWLHAKYSVCFSNFLMHQWISQGNTGFGDLKIVECLILEVSGNDVLVKFHAASINYPGLTIANVSSMGLACSLFN
jgi:hypothetical protein